LGFVKSIFLFFKFTISNQKYFQMKSSVSLSILALLMFFQVSGYAQTADTANKISQVEKNLAGNFQAKAMAAGR